MFADMIYIRIYIITALHWSLKVDSSEIHNYKRAIVSFLETISQNFIENIDLSRSTLSCSVVCTNVDCVLFKVSDDYCITYSKGIGASSGIKKNETRFYVDSVYLGKFCYILLTRFILK